jgi:hypothetical protein
MPEGIYKRSFSSKCHKASVVRPIRRGSWVNIFTKGSTVAGIQGRITGRHLQVGLEIAERFVGVPANNLFYAPTPGLRSTPQMEVAVNE